MGNVRFAVLALLAAAMAAQSASAAAPRVKKYYIPPAKSAALKPTQPVPPAPAAPSPALGMTNRLAAGRAMSRPLTQSGLQRGLIGLPAVGDTAPQCRSACAQTRFVCLSTDGDTCDDQWTACLAGCRG